jgi:predicted signal transduction protein with EAL and GGDEF domain
VVVCNNTDENAAEHAAARLLESLADPVDVSDTPMYLSASVGIAVSPPMDADALLSQADAAMYDAKARGRARARMFDAAQNPDAQERHQLSNDLRKALDQQALEVWYQPVVDLANGEMLGVEALCRWNHPDRGMVPPVSFVTVAEDTGLIGALDRWVLNRACHDTRVMVDSGVLGSYGYVGVNLSARNVADIALQETVTSAVQAAGIPYSRIALEVTETGAMSEPENAGRLLDELRDLGVAITLDDFGTGYSSLSYLHQFPISTVKIDRAFVQHIVENREDLAITVSIIDLARSAQLFTVAEAIETTDQLNLLRAMGCRAGQGYLWSPALPLEQLISLVNDQPNKRFRTWNGGGTTSRRPPNLEVTIGHGLKRLMDMHQQGASLDTIAAGLNKEGFKTPSDLRWHRSTVARVIADTLYPVRHQDGAPPGA